MQASDAPAAGPDAVLRMQFDNAITKFVVAQSDQLRILHKLQDKVCAQLSTVTKTPSSPPKSGLNAMIDELFARPEVHRGLIEWVGEEEACTRAKTLVAELQVDIKTGEGNDARTTLNKLLPLYMEALNVRALGVHAIPAASPGGKNGDKKLFLGRLVVECMQPFLEQIRMMYSDTVYDEESYSSGKGEDFKETTKRLKAALFVFLNTGNYASHNRGKLSFCQQIELCGAVGAMAETLPVVFQACQAVQLARTLEASGKKSPKKRETVADATSPSTSPRKEPSAPPHANDELPVEIKIGEESGIFVTSSEQLSQGSDITNLPEEVESRGGEYSPVAAKQPINLATYYREYLIDSSRAKYEDTLMHMEKVPKARVCVNGISCSNADCGESHSTLEALAFNPLIATLKCPVPKTLWHDSAHKNKCCLFNHGDFKGAGTFRWCKKILCWSLAGCKNPECLRSHSLAEVCWFNPNFRTDECVQGNDCQWKRNCSAFHKEFHNKKRIPGTKEYIGVAERILFPERTFEALRKVPLPSPSKAKANKSPTACAQRNQLATRPSDLIKYHKKRVSQMPISSLDQEKYTRVLSQMQMVPTARMCMNGEHYKQDDSTNLCASSHSVIEALSFNPLAIVLTCPTPVDCRDDFIHEKGLCIFHHGDKPVPKDFLKTKNLLCELMENCEDETCTKSHSIAEICWFFPIFRVNKCPQGDSCKRKEKCSLYHSEYHEKRDPIMNNTVGKTESALFISRTYSVLASKTTSLQSREDVEGVPSCELSEVTQQVSRTDVGGTDESFLRLKQQGHSYMLRYDEALNKCSDVDRVKYEQVLEHMKVVSKARLCTKSENHVGVETCTESHSRLEALESNPLAMILKCPISSDTQCQSRCVFDHDKGSIPKGFLKDKKLLCEDFDACGNANCVKSHSFAEVCWFNPQFRVADCPKGSECPNKQTCVGSHSGYCGRRTARMNSQVGTTEKILFVGRVYGALIKRRTQALSDTHPNVAVEPTSSINPETFQEDEIVEMENASEAENEDGDEPNCKLS
ncbi:hypothetical protein F444_15093 [Phytophthora nicotianae P1976]|uniref:Uncharacterized protein n=1 Tax=Phytophthora nicotianae P1976 TaxID=1317066 RepID=A0A080ZN30_PHYNI|nr:hypothetical protein F444_15093 [Phytophthora nicotianae P1976]